MKYPEDRFLFTVKEISDTCGISRTTLLRLEEDGFLKPYRIDPESGYRYYDANNIAQIGQYQLLQGLDISRKEITGLYYQKVDTKEFIRDQREKLGRLQRLIDELEIRYDRSTDFVCSYVELPETTCFCHTMSGANSAEARETMAYDTYQKIVKAGFKVCGSEPMFLILPDSDPSDLAIIEETEVTLCIPVRAPYPSAANLTTFPACHAFSVSTHGAYDSISALTARFKEEISSRRLQPSGQVRLIMLVAPYVGEHISSDDFCYEYVVPIEKMG